MMASVFVGTSVDGFIARPNGDLDWLPAGGGEPHGYDEFIATVDTIVIGKKTAEDLEAIFLEGERSAKAIDRDAWERQRTFGARLNGFWVRLWEGLL